MLGNDHNMGQAGLKNERYPGRRQRLAPAFTWFMMAGIRQPGVMCRMRFIRRRFWYLVLGCSALALLILVLMPAEKTLGQVIKVVYLHGALSRAGMLGFVAAGIAGIAYLIARKPALERWTGGLLLSAWGFWTAHFLVSMPATRLTWGPWVAWGEPRVTMTLQVIAAGLGVIVVTRLLKDGRFTAAAAGLLGLAVALLALRTGVIRHPLDPIGTSPSALLRLVYLLLILPLTGCMVIIAARLAGRTSEV